MSRGGGTNVDPRGGDRPRSTRPELSHCPRCSQRLDPDERWCWWCQVDLERYTGRCTECGLPHDLGAIIADYVRDTKTE